MVKAFLLLYKKDSFHCKQERRIHDSSMITYHECLTLLRNGTMLLLRAGFPHLPSWPLHSSLIPRSISNSFRFWAGENAQPLSAKVNNQYVKSVQLMASPQASLRNQCHGNETSSPTARSTPPPESLAICSVVAPSRAIPSCALGPDPFLFYVFCFYY